MNLNQYAAHVLQIELEVAQRERVPIRVQPSPALGRRGATNTPGAAMAAAQELEQVGKGCLRIGKHVHRPRLWEPDGATLLPGLLTGEGEGKNGCNAPSCRAYAHVASASV